MTSRNLLDRFKQSRKAEEVRKADQRTEERRMLAAALPGVLARLNEVAKLVPSQGPYVLWSTPSEKQSVQLSFEFTDGYVSHRAGIFGFGRLRSYHYIYFQVKLKVGLENSINYSLHSYNIGGLDYDEAYAGKIVDGFAFPPKLTLDAVVAVATHLAARARGDRITG
jgi:hypothetical protein